MTTPGPEERKMNDVQQGKCKQVVPGTVIACGECGNYCSPECYMSALEAALAAAEQERDQLRTRVGEVEKENERLREYEPRVLSMHGADVKLMVAKGTILNMAEAFMALNGEANYTETEVHTPKGVLRVTVHSPGRKTDHQLRKEAEAERDRLARRVEELEGAVDSLPSLGSAMALDPCVLTIGKQPREAHRAQMIARRNEYLDGPAATVSRLFLAYINTCDELERRVTEVEGACKAMAEMGTQYEAVLRRIDLARTTAQGSKQVIALANLARTALAGGAVRIGGQGEIATESSAAAGPGAAEAPARSP